MKRIGVILLIALIIQLCACSKLPEPTVETENKPITTTNQCEHVSMALEGKAATCTETGLSEGAKCSLCGEILKEQEIIPALGHTTDAGICRRCGQSFGDWITHSYVDKWGETTGDKYVTTKEPITGQFSNTATNNSDLTVQLLVDKDKISFFLYEYNNHQVKSSLDRGYNILYRVGTKESRLTGTLSTDRIIVTGKDCTKLITDLQSGNNIKFIIEEQEFGASEYKFEVESSNFSDEYRQNILGEKLIDSTTNPSTTETPATETPIAECVRGVVSEDAYENEMLDLRIALPEGWVFYTDEQIAQVNNITAETLAGTDVAELIGKNGQFMDMMMAGGTGSNMNLMLQPKQAVLDAYSDEQIFTLSEATFKAQFEASGMEVKSFEPVEMQVGGETRTVLHIGMRTNGMELDEYQIWLRNEADYMGVLTLAIMDGSDPQPILDGITKLN